MSEEKRLLFREHALQHYMQRREKDILPHLLKPPTFLLCWLFFVLLAAATVIAWQERIPIFTNGSGVLSPQQPLQSAGNDARATIFLPASIRAEIHTGSTGLVQLESTGQSYPASIVRIEPGVLSAVQAQTRYQLSCSTTQAFTEPMVVADVSLKLPASVQPSPGTLVQAQVQTGSKRVLALLPGFDSLIGE